MTPHFDVKMCQSGSHWTGSGHCTRAHLPVRWLWISRTQADTDKTGDKMLPWYLQMLLGRRCVSTNCRWHCSSCPCEDIPLSRNVTRVLSFQLIDGRGADNISLITSWPPASTAGNAKFKVSQLHRRPLLVESNLHRVLKRPIPYDLSVGIPISCLYSPCTSILIDS